MSDSHAISDIHRTFTQEGLHKFRYLSRYGCELAGIEDDIYGVEITFKNQTTGIKISLEDRENDILVYLIRLLNGEIPPYLDAPSRWYYLDNLVRLKSPSATPHREDHVGWLTPDDIDNMLSTYAELLKEYGEDVLGGDFSAFGELAKSIDRPRSPDGDGEVRLITSNEALKAQQRRLPAQIAEYYDTYFLELRTQLQMPDVFAEAVPDFLKGYKKIISVGGGDGLVVAHFPAELEITISKTEGGSVLMQFPSIADPHEDTYGFITFPNSMVSDIATQIGGGEDIGLEIPAGEMPWGVRGFSAPQQKIDSATGELIWQAPWTRLVCADFYHLRYWEDVDRARKEAREDAEPYIHCSRHLVTEKYRWPSHSNRWIDAPESEVREKLTVDVESSRIAFSFA